MGEPKGVVYGDLCDHELHAGQHVGPCGVFDRCGGVRLHQFPVDHGLDDDGHAGQTPADPPPPAARVQLEHGWAVGFDLVAGLVWLSCGWWMAGLSPKYLFCEVH